MLFFSQSFKLMVCWGKACYHRLLGESMYKTFSQYFLLQGIWYSVKYRSELCCGIIFSGKKKSSRNFGCRAIRRTDKSYCCRRWSVCSRCLGEFLPCVLQLLLKADLKLVRLQRSWSQPVGLSPETTLSMELYAQNLTFSDKNNQKRTKVSSMSSLTEISVLGNIFPSIVCLSFDRSSGFSFHLICSCKSRVGNSDWRRVMSELLKKHPSWRNVAVSIALRILKGFDTCSSLKWHL